MPVQDALGSEYFDISKAGSNPTSKLDSITVDFFLVKERAGQASASVRCSGSDILSLRGR